MNIDWQMHYLPLRVAGLYTAPQDEVADFKMYAFATSDWNPGIGKSLRVKQGRGHSPATEYRRSISETTTELHGVASEEKSAEPGAAPDPSRNSGSGTS